MAAAKQAARPRGRAAAPSLPAGTAPLNVDDVLAHYQPGDLVPNDIYDRLQVLAPQMARDAASPRFAPLFRAPEPSQRLRRLDDERGSTLQAAMQPIRTHTLGAMLAPMHTLLHGGGGKYAPTHALQQAAPLGSHQSLRLQFPFTGRELICEESILELPAAPGGHAAPPPPAEAGACSVNDMSTLPPDDVDDAEDDVPPGTPAGGEGAACPLVPTLPLSPAVDGSMPRSQDDVAALHDPDVAVLAMMLDREQRFIDAATRTAACAVVADMSAALEAYIGKLRVIGCTELADLAVAACADATVLPASMEDISDAPAGYCELSFDPVGAGDGAYVQAAAGAPRRRVANRTIRLLESCAAVWHPEYLFNGNGTLPAAPRTLAELVAQARSKAPQIAMARQFVQTIK